MRAIAVLFNYLKNGKGFKCERSFTLDPKVFKRFKPNKQIIKNMNLQLYVLASPQTGGGPKDAELALDFCAFLLRYHRELDYGDFAEEQVAAGRIRRAEVFRAWGDIEDLANGYETINANFEKHRAVTSNAFQELVKLVEKVKAECVGIANQGAGNTVAPWASQLEGDLRRDIGMLKNAMAAAEGKLAQGLLEGARFQAFSQQVQAEVNRINEQQVQFDANLKLLAEGTLSLSDKDKQYSTKLELMRKELQTLGQAIETRIDAKLSTYESTQQMAKATIETQLDQAVKRYGDQFQLTEKRLQNLLEERTSDTKRVTQEVLSKSLEAVKHDYETIINRLGAQIQELLTRLKQDQAAGLSSLRRDFEDNTWSHKAATEDALKAAKAAAAEELLRVKEDARRALDDSEKRTNTSFARMLDEATRAIEDQINNNLVSQMKQLDEAMKDSVQRLNVLDAGALVKGEKLQRLEEAAGDHIDLIESVNRKVDKVAAALEDNKALVIDKLAVFQAGVIAELKEATSHFSFKAYEESFRKIELDMDTFYKELLKITEESESRGKELAEWKQRLGGDLLNFYKKYDSQATDAGALSKAEKDSLNTLVAEMADNIAKSNTLNILTLMIIVDQKSIQLLAKEVAVFQATFQAGREAAAEEGAAAGQGSSAQARQIQELYAQIRKLSTDLFDQIKALKMSPQEQQATFDREKEALRL